VCLVVGADDQPAGQRIQFRNPLPAGRPATDSTIWAERTGEQVADFFRQSGKRDAGRRGQHLGALCISGEAFLGDCFLDRHFAPAEELASEWVTAHEEKVKDEDSKSKVILIWCSDDLPEFRILQFRGSAQRHTDFARINLSVCRDLKTIAVDKVDDGRLWGNANVTLVDVTNHVAMLVNYGESSGDVGSGVNQESPIGFRREFAPAAFRIVKKMDVLEAGDVFHEQASHGLLAGRE